MIEGSCVVDISGGINAAPLWIRQYQARAKMKLATDDEHGAAANRTAHLGSDLGISCKVVCTRPRELPVTNHTCIIHPRIKPPPGYSGEASQTRDWMRNGYRKGLVSYGGNRRIFRPQGDPLSSRVSDCLATPLALASFWKSKGAAHC
jgi:hypothetical protein